MKDKREIDKIRESGGEAEIGTPEDGAILEMINVGNRLIILKEKSIYELLMADDIDPDRTNINVPKTIHKKLIDNGPDSKIVSRIFLTAKNLFSKAYYDENIDTDKLFFLSIEILQEIHIFNSEFKNYLSLENKAINEYEQSKKSSHSYSLPSIPNLESKCKTIFQKADHIEQILMEIIINFYSNEGLNKQSHFPKFLQVLEKKYGKEDSFTTFISSTIKTMVVVRQVRNGLDHRLSFVTVKDFEIQADTSVITPSIELNHKDVKLERVSLSHILPIYLENLISIIELTITYLAGKNVIQSFMPYQIREIPLEKRRYKHVRYCFWSPLGEGGYFHQ